MQVTVLPAHHHHYHCYFLKPEEGDFVLGPHSTIPEIKESYDFYDLVRLFNQYNVMYNYLPYFHPGLHTSDIRLEMFGLSSSWSSRGACERYIHQALYCARCCLIISPMYRYVD